MCIFDVNVLWVLSNFCFVTQIGWFVHVICECLPKLTHRARCSQLGPLRSFGTAQNVTNLVPCREILY